METATANGGAGDAASTNGLSEEELERQRMRPADVDADMREMSRRKRVEAVLQSPAFRVRAAGCGERRGWEWAEGGGRWAKGEPRLG